MNRINIDGWKKFRIGDIFDVVNGSPYHKNQLEIQDESFDGGIPYVTRSAIDNGVFGYVADNGKYNRQPANTIAFGAETAYFSFQSSPYLVGNKMYYLDFLKNIDPSKDRKSIKSIGLFLCSVLNREVGSKYSFSNGLTGSVCKDEFITLPCRNKLAPDWKSLAEILGNISCGGGYSMKNIDTSKWAEFKLGDICNIVRGRTKVINKLSYGDIPVISSGRKNQGIVGNYNLEAEYSDTLTIACNGSCGSTFYHDGPFAITGDASVCLFKDNLPYSIKLFIASILDEYLTQKYNYEQKCSPEILKSETIKLPAMKQYTPDWHQLNELTDCKFGGGYMI